MSIEILKQGLVNIGIINVPILISSFNLTGQM